MSGKSTVVISTCGFYTAEGNYDGIYSLFNHLCGQENYTTIFCGQGELFHIPEMSTRTNEYLSYVKQAGHGLIFILLTDSSFIQISCRSCFIPSKNAVVSR